MESVTYCPYRTQVNWSTIQTTQLTAPLTFTGTVQVTQLTAPVTFTGTSQDVELLEACKEKPDGPGAWLWPDNLRQR